MTAKLSLPFAISTFGRVRKPYQMLSPCRPLKNAQTSPKDALFQHIPSRWFCSHSCLQKQAPSLPNLEPKGHTTRKTEVKTRLFGKFFDYMKGYEVILEKLLPDVAFKFYKIFSNGTKLLFKDMKEFIWIHHILSSTSNWEQSCKTMTRKQLELYLALPSELIRVAPVLAISAFPMAQNLVFPLALWAPKRFLSIHFWSDEIKKEVSDINISIRQSYYMCVFRNMVTAQTKFATSYSNLYRTKADLSNSPRMQSFLHALKGSDTTQKAVTQNSTFDGSDQENLCRTYQANMLKLITGQHPSISEILDMVPYFTNKGPLSLTRLSSSHVRYLLKIHNRKHVGFTAFWFPRTKLQVYANMILQIDKAIERENPANMNKQELSDCCLVRGLNMNSVSEEDARSYLDAWIKISSNLKNDTSSLLLHLPILLGYNHKSRYINDRTE